MGEDLGSMLECGGQRTVYGKGMGVNIWGIDTKDTFGFSILWNLKFFWYILQVVGLFHLFLNSGD